jgi:peptide/nickel transport system substrate-binding protein
VSIRRISGIALCATLILSLSAIPLASSRSDIVFDWSVTPTSVIVDKSETFEITAEVSRISGEGFVQIRAIPSPALYPAKEFIISNYFDGNSSAKESISVRVILAGNHTLTVEALVGDDVSNLKYRDEQVVNVLVPQPLRANILASTTNGDAPLTITFTPNISGGTPPFTYEWRFDDGTTSSEANPTHTFEDPGFYRVTFNLKDSRARGYTALQVITVTKDGAVYNPIRTVQNLTQGVANAPPNATYASDASEPSGTSNGGKCLIATATFGSELAPQVQLLREFRDKRIMSTVSGSSFMGVFNAWYYSFSPYVADYEREQPWLQQTAKGFIYPTLAILQLSEKASLIDGEYGALIAGFVAGSLIGAVYFSPLVLAIKPMRQYKLSSRNVLLIFGVVLAGVFVGIFSNNTTILAFSTSSFVLSTLAISAMVSARWFYKHIIERRRNNLY